MYLTSVIAVLALSVLHGGESTTLQVSLNRTMPPGTQSVCPDELVIFTCRVSGSNIISWSSTEYIESTLEFTITSMTGMNITSNGVVAVLTNKSLTERALESQLRLHARVNSVIGCRSGDANSEQTVSLTITNGPGIPADVAAVEITSAGGICTVLVDWDPPIGIPEQDVDHLIYIIRYSISGVIEMITTTSTLATFQLSQCTEDFHFNISTVNLCEQEGPVINVKPVFLTTESVNDTITTRNPSDTGRSSPVTTIVSVSAVMIFILAMLVIFLTIRFYCRRTRQVTGVRGDQFPLLSIGSKLKYTDDDDKPKYTKDDLMNVQLPQPTQEQEQDIKKYMSKVMILLHTVKQEETVAVYNHLRPPLEAGTAIINYCTSTGNEIYLGIFGNHKAAMIRTSEVSDCGHEIKLALKCLPQVQLIIAAGFAYGRRDKCKLGDVLVSTAIAEISNLGIRKGDKGGTRLTSISEKAKRAFTKGNWIGFACTDDDRESEIHCGVVVSSPMLLSSEDALKKLFTMQESFIGGEMVGQELAQLSIDSGGEKYSYVDFIVIKGVADFGDGTKEKDWQFTASLAAAAFAETKLEESQNRVYRFQHAGDLMRLNFKIDEQHFDRIAGVVNTIEGRIAAELGLTPSDLTDILSKHPYDKISQMKAALVKWKQKNGANATYNNLIRALERADVQQFADVVEQLASQRISDIEDGEVLPTPPKRESDILWSQGQAKVKGAIQGKGNLTKLIGETVIKSSDRAKVPVSTLEKEGSVVGLFFSAHWCPPSCVFTPKLVSWYNHFLNTSKGHLLNIVFISSDQNASAFWKYFEEMPWYSVDYDDWKTKNGLADKFRVDGIPTLIFVDGITGKLINKNGREVVESDPDGSKFPWNPPSLSEIMADCKFIGPHGQERTWSELKGHIIAIFIALPWSKDRTSKAFSSELALLYNKLKESGKKFEIIYVDCGVDAAAWQEYVDNIPWLALPFGDKRVKDLAATIDLDEIPTLIILNENGDVITTRGCNCVQNDPLGLTFPWYVNSLTEETTKDISETPSLIWFVPTESKHKAKEELEKIAKEHSSNCAKGSTDLKFLFFLSCRSNHNEVIVKYIRGISTLPDTTEPQLIIVNISQRKVYICASNEISGDCVQKFFSDYLKDRLDGKALVPYRQQRNIEADVVMCCSSEVTFALVDRVDAERFGNALVQCEFASETALSTLMYSPEIPDYVRVEAIYRAIAGKIVQARSPEEARELFNKVVQAFAGLPRCMEIAQTLISVCKMKDSTYVSPLESPAKPEKETPPRDAHPETKGAHA